MVTTRTGKTTALSILVHQLNNAHDQITTVFNSPKKMIETVF